MKKTSIFFFFLLFINLAMCVKLFDGQSGIPAYRELKFKIAQVQGKIEDIDLSNRQISSEIRVLKKDDKYVERLIKRELFYLSDQEIMYIFK